MAGAGLDLNFSLTAVVIQRQLVPALTLDGHTGFLFLGVIVKSNNVSAPGVDRADMVLALAVHALRRSIVSVPKSSQDKGMVNIAVLKGHQHLISYFWNEVSTPAIAGHESSDARPEAVGAVFL
jgi:hypothetical protein